MDTQLTSYRASQSGRRPSQVRGSQIRGSQVRASRSSRVVIAGDGDAIPINSDVVTAMTRMRQSMKLNNEIDRERRVSRASRGLNPDVKPIPVEVEVADNRGGQITKKAHDKEQKFRNMDEHRIPMDQLCKRFNTSLENGLTTALALERNREEGDNKLPEKKKTPAWIRFLLELTNWFSILLWVGSILCIITFIIQPSQNLPNLYLGLILIFVILLTGAITFMQSAKSDALMDSFKNMMPSNCTVVRDGKLTTCHPEKLVRGDVVQMKGGDKVPADLRIIQSIEMKVDNSPLTGQSDPLLRTIECSHPDEPLQTKNLAFFGTLVKEGKGRGIVVNIAEKTVLGQIADLASSGETIKSPLRKQLDRFVLLITVIALVLGVGFFILARVVTGLSYLECMIFGIGILVANVPEGLLGCITISLAITAQRLHQKQVLVKNLEAVETLGSTSCICSDKTGTLTKNKMTVENVWYDGQIHRAQNKEKYKGQTFKFEYDTEDPAFICLHDAAIISSEAKFDVSDDMFRDPNFKWSEAPVIGDASQTALVKFFQPIEDIGKTRDKYRTAICADGSIAKMPFNSTNKYALTIVEQPIDDSYYCLYIKGAPEKIWKFCSRVMSDGRIKEIDEEMNRRFDAVNLRFGKNGQRVLGFAKLHLLKEQFPRGFNFNVTTPLKFNFPMQNFVFVGLVSLMDPPKDSVPYAVLKCRSAGIKVIMVTGDQPPTAAAIAKQVNIISSKTVDQYIEEGLSKEDAFEKAKAIVIHGDMIVKAYEEGEEEGELKLMTWVNKPQCVFARTTPAQKLKIVRACQRSGRIVGVTGDGVNDSPAIKQGDIGISMGITGSDVTKDAADMILLNDDFASIVDGIEEGRKIFDNLKKTVVYLLTSNITEIFPFLAYVCLRIPLPLSNIFMLVICVGTDILPAISLAYEESQVDIMTRKPRKLDEHLVSMKLLVHAYGQMGEIATAAGFFSYFVTMFVYGFPFSAQVGIITINGYLPSESDKYYNNSAIAFGNSNIPSSSYANCTSYYTNNPPTWSPDWIGLTNTGGYADMRQSLIFCNSAGKWQQTGPAFNMARMATCRTDQISGITKHSPCYTTQAVYYGQSAYFVAIVMVQWSNIISCKSRKASFIYSSVNKVMLLGILVETSICVFLLYVPGVNTVFGGRQLSFFLVGTPGLCFSVLLLLWVQIRKIFINTRKRGQTKPNWFEVHCLW